MKEVSIFDAKANFAGLVDRIYNYHESVTITRGGIKIAKIVPIENKQEINVAAILRQLQALSDEIGHVGITVSDIKKIKKEGL